MRQEDMRESENVEDRTGMRSAGSGFPIGGGGIKLGRRRADPDRHREPAVRRESAVADRRSRVGAELAGATGAGLRTAARRPPAPSDPAKVTASRVLGDTEDVWTAVFKTLGGTYQPPTLVLFPGRVRSACGIASEAAGPFYCPGDQKLYLDTTFFDELAQRFRAPGDFAQAYVIAHEVGHHVQNLTGTMRQVDAQRQRLGERGNNALSVRLELQADCYAGVWAYFAQKRNKLDPGDIEEGLAAAAAVGDDRIQRADARLRRARLVHARLRRPAPVLVQGRPRERRRAQVRHVRSARALTAFDVHVQDKPTPCPGCAATMQPLRLTRKLEGELTVDLCADCQALWFDAFESGQLTPGATLELFEAIRKAAAGGAPRAARSPAVPALHAAAVAHPRPPAHDAIPVLPVRERPRPLHAVRPVPPRKGFHPAAHAGRAGSPPGDDPQGQLLVLRRTGRSREGIRLSLLPRADLDPRS